MFRKYEKIHRLGKDEVDGILDGLVAVQEKIDGANTSIWTTYRDYGIDILTDLHYGSRNKEIIDNEFNGFIPYIKHTAVPDLLDVKPQYVLYGEWLVKHTVAYNQESYKRWYLFDIFDRSTAKYLLPHQVEEIAFQHGLNFPTKFGFLDHPTIDDLKQYVGKSSLGPVGEGIVIKRADFVNKWGDNRHAKLVRQEFLEDNALLFNSNNKHSETYNEQYIVNKWLNAVRVKKICDKLQPEINEPLDLKHIPRITNTVYHDLITEEAWEIAKLNKPVEYSKLKTLAMKKAKLLYMELLEKGDTKNDG